jgi:hypothetical protein
MLVSFRLVIASGVLMLSTTQASSAGAQGRTDTNIALEASATVEIIGRTGDVTVRGANDRQLRVQQAGDAQVQVRGGGRALVLDATGSRSRGSEALDITLPRGTALIVRTQTGDISVRGVGADVEVRTTSGNVTVDDAARVRIETVAGDVSLRNVRDGARVNATSGDVELVSVTGDVEVSGTSSTVLLRDVDSRRVDVKVVSGDVRWTGPFAESGRYAFSAHSGDVRFVLPRNTRATLDVRTLNGNLSTTDLPLTLVPDPSAAERDADRARDVNQLRIARDSIERLISDSLRRADRPRSGRDRSSVERDFEQSVERLVESVMRGVSRGMESLALSIDGAVANDRTRRFTLGRDGGPLVTISTFNGDIIFGTSESGRR